MKLCIIVGARPNFIKAAPIITAIKKYKKKHKDLIFFTIHTGQHFDENMSDIFFMEMQMPKPDYLLKIDTNIPQGKQTAQMITQVEGVLINEMPNIVISIGDTNSTLAGALAASKLNIPIAHVEAGLRMYNKKFSEDINRLLTDHMSSLLFVPSDIGKLNLKREGISNNMIYQYGDVMYDALLQFDKIADKKSTIFKDLGLKKKDFVLLTIHRAENTNTIERLRIILDALVTISKEIKIVFPLHPRTNKLLKEHDLFNYYAEHFKIIDPIGYLDMLVLEKKAKLVVTDSGGVQKEAFFQKTPCVFLFDDKTTWVELVKLGWLAEIAPKSTAIVVKTIKRALISKGGKKGNPYGKGNAAELMVSEMISFMRKNNSGK